MKVQTYLKTVLENTKKREIVGNAFSDHDLMNELYTFAIVAAQLNCPDLAFDAYDFIGTDVMGVAPMEWAEFVLLLTDWHRNIWPTEAQ